MTGRRPYVAGAGVVAVALFLAAALVLGPRPAADASGGEVVRDVVENRTRIQIGCALSALAGPFLVAFLAGILALSRQAAPGAQPAALTAFGCGLAFVTLYLADVSALAVAALRPEVLISEPALASVLRDLEWVMPAMAAFLLSGFFVGCAAIALQAGALWPRWLGWLALVAAAAYGLRTGALFTTEGPFAADGLLALYVPLVAGLGWITLASSWLLRSRPGA